MLFFASEIDVSACKSHCGGPLVRQRVLPKQCTVLFICQKPYISAKFIDSATDNTVYRLMFGIVRQLFLESLCFALAVCKPHLFFCHIM